MDCRQPTLSTAAIVDVTPLLGDIFALCVYTVVLGADGESPVKDIFTAEDTTFLWNAL